MPAPVPARCSTAGNAQFRRGTGELRYQRWHRSMPRPPRLLLPPRYTPPHQHQIHRPPGSTANSTSADPPRHEPPSLRWLPCSILLLYLKSTYPQIGNRGKKAIPSNRKFFRLLSPLPLLAAINVPMYL